MKVCCFTGHRSLSYDERKQILSVLTQKIEELINSGIAVFINGGALGFDTLSALAVLGLKKKYPKIKLKIYAPHKEQSLLWSEENKRIYEYILYCADEVKFLADKNYTGCMHERNRRMVDDSDCVIAYVKKPSGGSYYTAAYAESKDKKVYYI